MSSSAYTLPVTAAIRAACFWLFQAKFKHFQGQLSNFPCVWLTLTPALSYCYSYCISTQLQLSRPNTTDATSRGLTAFLGLNQTIFFCSYSCWLTKPKADQQRPPHLHEGSTFMMQMIFFHRLWTKIIRIPSDVSCGFLGKLCVYVWGGVGWGWGYDRIWSVKSSMGGEAHGVPRVDLINAEEMDSNVKAVAFQNL